MSHTPKAVSQNQPFVLQEILEFFDGCAQTEQVGVQVDDDGPEPAVSHEGHVPP